MDACKIKKGRAMKYRFNETLPKDYLDLAKQVGRRITPVQANSAMRGSLFTVGIYDDSERLVAFGRICGDGVLCFTVTDIMVDDAFTESHLEENILKEISDFIREHRCRESSVMIHVSREYGNLCRKYGFRYLDEDYEVIMKG